jgi:AcrR family transcriptional regulator
MSQPVESDTERADELGYPAARARGRPRDERVTQAITEAALRQLQDEGYARLSMESVASEAGVARATVYRRFKDKADLVTAAIAGYAGLGPALGVPGGGAEAAAGTAGAAGPQGAVSGPGARGLVGAMTPVPGIAPVAGQTGLSGHPRADLERFLLDFDDRFNRSCIEVLGGLLADREDPTALALHRERVIEPRRAYARALLEQARDSGELDPKADLDLALDMLTGVVIARAVGGRDLEPGWARRALDLVWRGAAAPT